ncbi:MAG: hypothetical protein IBJ11_08905 [Phycisphaerales bacterium]|nr:hypothetical protein [Phycisphaerales bacterium]
MFKPLSTGPSPSDGAAPAPDAAPIAPNETRGASLIKELAGGGVAPATETPGPASKHAGFLLLAAVVLAGAGVLLGMRKLGLGTRLASLDVKIDYQVDQKDLERLTKDHEKLIQELKSSVTVVQVPADQIQMNPFTWKMAAPEKPKGKADDSAARLEEETRRQAETRRAELKKKAESLRLGSIMGGRHPMAQISGQVVRVGDKVDGVFEVLAIEGRAVTLQAQDLKFQLLLGP